MATIRDLSSRLESVTQLNWTATQEKTISRDYPFAESIDEIPEQFVVRHYLQFLWLPEVSGRVFSFGHNVFNHSHSLSCR